MHPAFAETAVTVVSSHGCHLCDEARAALAEIGAQQPLRVRHLDADSPGGAALLAQHRVPMFPLVLVDGRYFSHGRLPRRKLQALLQTKTPAGTR